MPGVRCVWATPHASGSAFFGRPEGRFSQLRRHLGRQSWLWAARCGPVAAVVGRRHLILNDLVVPGIKSSGGALQPRHPGTNGIGVELHPAAGLRIPRQHRDADVGTWLDLDFQALEEARAGGERQDRWRRADLDLCPPRPDRAAV